MKPPRSHSLTAPEGAFNAFGRPGGIDMDSNGSRYHLLQGEADWPRWRGVDGAPLDGQIQWDAGRQQILLWPETFRFPPSPATPPLQPEQRRSAARDAFGNWYWISDDGLSVEILNSGSGELGLFWPQPAVPEPARDDGGFHPLTPVTPPALRLQGLAVTEDHYLVVGALGDAAGLLVFDLYSGSVPRRLVWPAGFEPWDMAAREEGGVFILDRRAARVWALDQRFELCVPVLPAAAQPLFGPTPRAVVQQPEVSSELAWPLPSGTDAISIDRLPDGSLLLMEAAGPDGHARFRRMSSEGVITGGAVSAGLMLQHLPIDSELRLRGHDCAVGARLADDPAAWMARAYLAGIDGQQAWAFGVAVVAGQLTLTALAEFYPMRLFGGRALVADEGQVFFDSENRWLPLTLLARQRYVADGELCSALLDGAEPGCVWHRLLLDACIPANAGIEVWSRASDDWRELMRLDEMLPAERELLGLAAAEDDELTPQRAWQPEPTPLRRAEPERPWVELDEGSSWELLFQRARGRYLQLRLRLSGNGRVTPRVSAVRAWYPRFSYLQHYLPAVYRDDAISGDLMNRLLANFEGVLTNIEDRMAAAQVLFDAQTAPADTLAWLASWLGVAMDPGWDEARRRLFIRHATDFFAQRGTVRGLQLALRLALDDCVDPQLFDDAATAPRHGVRIVERFRARQSPGLLAADITLAPGQPRLLQAGARWQPGLGGAELLRRYQLVNPAADQLPLTPPDTGAQAWIDFMQGELGFIPGAATAERRAWLGYQQRQGRAAQDLPREASSLWAGYLDGAAPDAQRQHWQDFLARRYRSIEALEQAWRAHWGSFTQVALFDHLPGDGAALADWHDFESLLEPMHAAAHRFIVMLPVPGRLRSDAPAAARRLALASQVLALEKPAHTTFELRYYWAMFRLGQARLGDDTLIDTGSRSSALMAPLVLGERGLADSYLAAGAGRDPAQRLRLGRDRIGRSGPLGGP